MNNLQSALGPMVADNWEHWTADTRLSLWRTFGQAEKQAIWDEYHDRPELCPEPAPVYEAQPQVMVGPRPIDGPQAEALRRFDELVASLPIMQPTIIRAELPQVKPKPVHGYELPPPAPKPQPAPSMREPGHVTTVAELPTEVKVKACLCTLGWIFVIWFFIHAFG